MRRTALRHALSGGDRIGHYVPGFGEGRTDPGVAGLAHRQVSRHLVSMSPHTFRDRGSGRCLVGHDATVWIGRKRRRGAFLPAEWGSMFSGILKYDECAGVQ
ncbi:hypothetical protein SHKM778_54880 [Streptomyces sp. KM77-8]|uniref:Uncharacterized protein n=1 Tax=Streptomyces haneummycinicus TaxID=3074435 RepID=A0AAT9HNR0_9ACTN